MERGTAVRHVGVVDRPRPSHRLRVAVLILAMALATGGGVATWRATTTGAAATLPTVAVRTGPLVKSVIATGRIEAESSVEVRPKVNGQIAMLAVDTGDTVTAGQVVARLDDELARRKVEEAHAALEAARAGAERSRGALTPARRDFARDHLARLETLYRDGIISAQELQRGSRDAEIAMADYDAARAALRVAEAQVKQAEAALARAEQELRDTTIVSPLSGTVLARPVDVGTGVSAAGSLLEGAGTSIMTIGDTSSLHVVGELDEVDVGLVRLDQPARLRVDAFPDLEFMGRVSKIAPQGNHADSVVNFEIEVAIVGEADGLRPNMTADAEVIVAQRASALLVPEAVVERDGAQAFVRRPGHSDEAPERVPVVLGLGNGSEVEIVSGLAAGETVVGPTP